MFNEVNLAVLESVTRGPDVLSTRLEGRDQLYNVPHVGDVLQQSGFPVVLKETKYSFGNES